MPVGEFDLNMFSFESAFSRKRCIFVGQGGAACGDPPLSDSRVSLPGQLRVPWVRADQTKFANHWDNSVTAAKLRVSELCNTTILALEKISTGYLQRWGGRRYNRSDTIEIDPLSNSFDGLKSARCTDLLIRISSFWRDWEERFRKAGCQYFQYSLLNIFLLLFGRKLRRWRFISRRRRAGCPRVDRCSKRGAADPARKALASPFFIPPAAQLRCAPASCMFTSMISAVGRCFEGGSAVRLPARSLPGYRN